jgi:hypothetical protein
MIKHYDSIAAIRADWLAKGKSNSSGTDNSWYGESRDQTVRRSLHGDPSLVQRAETMLAELDTAVETPRHQWERSPAGAYACVPDVLAGLPTPMRRQVYVPDDRAPLTLLVNTTCSGGIPADVMQRRGIVILALTMALARIRPISLHVLATMDGYGGETVFTAQINTTPLDLATACYALTSVGFARRLTYDLGRGLNGFTGGWPRGYRYGNPKAYNDALVPRLGYNPKDTLLIPAAELSDRLLQWPIEWVNEQIARFTSAQEEELV